MLELFVSALIPALAMVFFVFSVIFVACAVALHASGKRAIAILALLLTILTYWGGIKLLETSHKKIVLTSPTQTGK